jgi:hypothetical protein
VVINIRRFVPHHPAFGHPSSERRGKPLRSAHRPHAFLVSPLHLQLRLKVADVWRREAAMYFEMIPIVALLAIQFVAGTALIFDALRRVIQHAWRSNNDLHV